MYCNSPKLWNNIIQYMRITSKIDCVIYHVTCRYYTQHIITPGHQDTQPKSYYRKHLKPR